MVEVPIEPHGCGSEHDFQPIGAGRCKATPVKIDPPHAGDTAINTIGLAR